jgi:hypothetical protein
MSFVEDFYVEAVCGRTLQPKPVTLVSKILIGKYIGLDGVRGAAHEFVGPVLLRHDEIFHDVGLSIWTGELLGEHCSGKEKEQRCLISHGGTSRMRFTG